jgi:hypothetical protein
MERDERTPAEIQRDRLRQLQEEERRLLALLENVQAQMANLPAVRPS